MTYGRQELGYQTKLLLSSYQKECAVILEDYTNYKHLQGHIDNEEYAGMKWWHTKMHTLSDAGHSAALQFWDHSIMEFLQTTLTYPYPRVTPHCVYWHYLYASKQYWPLHLCVELPDENFALILDYLQDFQRTWKRFLQLCIVPAMIRFHQEVVICPHSCLNLSGMLENVWQQLFWGEVGALICSICQSLGCKYSHHDWFQGIISTSLDKCLGRDAYNHLLWAVGNNSRHLQPTIICKHIFVPGLSLYK